MHLNIVQLSENSKNIESCLPSLRFYEIPNTQNQE